MLKPRLFQHEKYRHHSLTDERSLKLNFTRGSIPAHSLTSVTFTPWQRIPDMLGEFLEIVSTKAIHYIGN